MKAFTRIVLFCSLFSLMPYLSHVQSEPDQGGYTYYGYIPAKIWNAAPPFYMRVVRNFTINPLTIAESGLVGIVAYADETEVEVYILPSNELVRDEKIDEMEKMFVTLPNGTFFKIHASKLVTVELLGGNVGGEELDPSMREGPTVASFYTSADGTYVGKEFIFIASQGLTGQPYRILALEESEVTLHKEDGSTPSSYSLKANEYTSLSLTAFRVYKVASTGNIMIQSGRGYVPSVDGGYTGTRFYTISLPGTDTWDPAVAYGFQVIAAEEAKVTIYDVEFRKEIDRFTVPAGRNVTVNPRSHEIFIESDKPISVAYVHHGVRSAGGWAYGAGLKYMGVSPDETSYVYIPVSTSQQSFVFAYKEGTVVTIDGAPIELDADEFFPLSSGLHEVETTENVLIQIVHWSREPDFQGIQNFGTVVPAIETLSARETVELKPILEAETFATTYIYAAVAAAVAVIAAAVTYYLKFIR